MKAKHLLATLFAAALLVFSSSAMAQQQEAPRNALRAGESALAFGVPGGGNPHVDGTLGYHYMVTDAVRGGLNLGFNYNNEEVDNLTLAPQLNLYTSTRGTVAPFVFGQVHYSAVNDFDDHNLGAALGYGVEWFPVTRFSISGQVGLGLDIVNPEDDFQVGLFTSSLAANIYF